MLVMLQKASGTAVLFHSTWTQAIASLLQQAESTWAAVLMIVILNAETVCHPQVLSTGAVVVDLPGVRDANAARGAVAEKYMKSCNAVWIVADITRAVDNRTAKVCMR